MDRYWVGGAGTWDATTTTNWATTSGGAGGASAPTSADNVIFDSLSNATLYTLTVGTNAVCNDLTAAGPLAGNVTFSLGATARIDCHGSMTLPASGLVWTGVNGCLVTFKATTTGKTITTNGVALTLTDITFNGVGGGWTLGSAITYGTNDTLTVTNGTFNTGNYNITGAVFAVNAVGTQVINLGSSTVTLSGTASITFSQTAGLTFNAGTSQINLSAFSPNFAGGGKIFYNVSFTSNAGGTPGILNANTFNDLSFTSKSATGTRIFSVYDNQTVNGTLTLGAANTSIRRIQIQSNAIGAQRTITLNGTLATLADVDFRDIATAGSVGTWTGTRLGNGLGNSGITFDAAKDVYWNLAAGGSWDATGWALSSGGTPDANNFPLAQDKAIFENTGLNTSATITLNIAWWIGEFDASTRSNAMTFANTTRTPIVYKNVTLSSAFTMTGTGAWNFVGQGTTQILDTNTATFVPPITIASKTGTLQLAENTTCSGTVTLTSGTLNLNNFNLTCLAFSSSNTNTRVIAFGTNGIINCGGNFTATTGTNLTTSGTGAIKMSSASAKTFAGGGRVYTTALEQAGAGTLIITGANTFADMTNTAQPTTITFPASTITTFNNFNVNGTAGNLVTLNSSSPGTRFTLLETSLVVVNYLDIIDSAATPADTWYAINSTDSGNNTGWTFGAPVSAAVLNVVFNSVFKTILRPVF